MDEWTNVEWTNELGLFFESLSWVEGACLFRLVLK